jgi:hypothetical protein
MANAAGLTPVNLVTQEAEIRRILVQSLPPEKSFVRPYLENTRHKKRTGRVVQVVKCLRSNHEAQSSNPRTAENKKKKKKKKWYMP